MRECATSHAEGLLLRAATWCVGVGVGGAAKLKHAKVLRRHKHANAARLSSKKIGTSAITRHEQARQLGGAG